MIPSVLHKISHNLPKSISFFIIWLEGKGLIGYQCFVFIYSLLPSYEEHQAGVNYEFKAWNCAQ
jgi:hypothetical protein